jgi:hypothetical protein
LVGIGVFCIGLSALSVFWHGVIISSLPAQEVRLSTAIAVVGGASAAMLGAVANDQIGSEIVSRRRSSTAQLPLDRTDPRRSMPLAEHECKADE